MSNIGLKKIMKSVLNERNNYNHLKGFEFRYHGTDYKLKDVEDTSRGPVGATTNGKFFNLDMLKQQGVYIPLVMATKVQMMKSLLEPKASGGWNDKKYKRWIKDSASEGGSDNAYDMARNASQESGLIDYVKKMIRRDGGDETALERIQWDIEAV